MTKAITATICVLGLTLAAAFGQGQAQKACTITVAPALAITTTTLPGGEVQMPYSGQLAVSGGVAPYSFSLLTVAPFGTCGAGPFGPLPAGLALSATGAITGTPTAVGTFPVCVQVKDSLGGVAAKRYGGLQMPAVGGHLHRPGLLTRANRKRQAIRQTLSRDHVDEAAEVGMVVLGAVTLIK